MATRSIVTSHPEIACEVCGRRLLRGEQPDVFLSGGQRRMVCELCVPRAAHEGWLREAEDHSISPRSSGPRRTRSLLGRLRQSRRPAADSSEADSELPLSGSPIVPQDGDDGLYDFLDIPLAGAQAGEREPDGREPMAAVPASGRSAAARSTPTSGELKVERALDVFNGGEHPRRVAGVARSLGTPSVRVAAVADSGSLVNVVVAWELCWYRYQVDLGDEQAGVQLLAQGMELDELPREDRVANAEADERGELSLLM
jgi:hypothetical protein